MQIWREKVPKRNGTNVTMPVILMILISFIFSTNFKFEQPPGHVFDRLSKTAPWVMLNQHYTVFTPSTTDDTMESYIGFTQNTTYANTINEVLQFQTLFSQEQ